MKKSLFLVIVASTLLIPIYSQPVELCQGYYLTEEAAVKKLKEFSDTYSDKKSWQKRAGMIRQGILAGTKLDRMPERCSLNPIRRNKQTFDGYTVENIAFESLPGFYVTGNLYLPVSFNGKIPGVLCPHGHWDKPEDYGRFRHDMQKRCATLAKMGAAVFAYDMVGYGESSPCVHECSEALRIQTWSSIRGIDFLLSLGYVDQKRLAVTGASGGGTQSFILAAVDKRIDLSVPAVQVSAHFYGGCNCESGMPIHKRGDFETNNVEIAASFAPKPQLLLSDGQDWTKNVPKVEFPYIQNVYKLMNAGGNVENSHFASEGHDYGYTKRQAMYVFMAKHFKLDLTPLRKASGEVNEDFVVLLDRPSMEVFNDTNPRPASAVRECSRVTDLMNKPVK